jgi:hypothetical protein
MTSDTGFAPNPFYGYCTLAACTPNHMHALLDKGDYIAGFFTDRAAPYLVYWLKVDEVLDYDEYFHDPRFKRKRPNLSGTWLSRCGDNIYCRDKLGKWVQKDTLYHKEKDLFDKDTHYAVVYIGREFSYFGANAYSRNNRLPKDCRGVLKKGKGIKYTEGKRHPYYTRYLSWLNSKPLGRHGNPRDRDKKGECTAKKQQNNSKDCRTSQCT